MMQMWDADYTDTYRRITAQHPGYHTYDLRARHVAELLHEATGIPHVVTFVGLGYAVGPYEWDQNDDPNV